MSFLQIKDVLLKKEKNYIFMFLNHRKMPVQDM